MTSGFSASETEPATDVHAGRDGWLFLTGGTNRVLAQYRRPGLSRRLLWRWRRIVSERVRACDRLGATYIHAVAPEKLTVYGDQAPDLAIDPARAPVRRLARWLTASRGARAFVDLDAAFQAARDGPPLYLRTDSHWTLAGCEVAYRTILARMGVAPRDDLDARRSGGTVAFCGDLGRKFTPHRFEPAPVTTFATGVRRVHANGLLTALEAEGRGIEAHLGAHAVFRNDDPAADPRRLVIFGDSFCQHTSYSPVATLTALMADTFAEVHFLWSTSIDWHYCERVRPDFVLGEIAERFMIDLPPKGFRIERLAELARARKLTDATPLPPDAPASAPGAAGAGPR
ncbi:alginate O-acetyltransferase AlgX-related protein [Methylorubrum sp. SB2]|uniref:alginate O-acetyltransferase AlgX-related protein n=1 Tax=Methylorubrum subtropicum TaxID=3138812 RepID=UPI00313D223E